MSNFNPYQSDFASTPIPTDQNSRSFLWSACLGAVSAAIVPLFFAILATIMAFRDTSNVRSIHAIWIWSVVVLVTAGVGALLGIAVGLFRRTFLRTDRKIVE
jgi:uncharacterized integral membrane protein